MLDPKIPNTKVLIFVVSFCLSVHSMTFIVRLDVININMNQIQVINQLIKDRIL